MKNKDKELIFLFNYQGNADQWCKLYKDDKDNFYYKDVAMPILPLNISLAKHYAWSEINRNQRSLPTRNQVLSKLGLEVINEYNFKKSDDAFNDALKNGILSEDKTKDNYIRNYMYMGTFNGKDSFKHIQTRKYL